MSKHHATKNQDRQNALNQISGEPFCYSTPANLYKNPHSALHRAATFSGNSNRRHRSRKKGRSFRDRSSDISREPVTQRARKKLVKVRRATCRGGDTFHRETHDYRRAPSSTVSPLQTSELFKRDLGEGRDRRPPGWKSFSFLTDERTFLIGSDTSRFLASLSKNEHAQRRPRECEILCDS